MKLSRSSFFRGEAVSDSMLHLIAICCALVVFYLKNFSSMIQMNSFWRTGAWYEFLATPSEIGTAGLLNPAAMNPYFKTLSISLGHQLVMSMNRWFGFELGLGIFYVIIAALVAISIYLIAWHLSQSKGKAFLITFLLVNTDSLALAHIGACGYLGQSAVRDYLALGFFLLGIYCFFEKKFYAYWLCLFVGFLFHLSHGLFAFAVLLPATWLLVSDLKFKVFHFSSFVVTLLGFYVYQSWGAVPMDPAYRDLWFKWAYIFNGGHIFWDHSINYLLPTYAFLSILAAGLSLAVVYSEKRTFLLSILVAWGVLAICAAIFIYVIPSMTAYQLTPFRSSLLVSSVLLVFILMYLLGVLSEAMSLSRLALSSAGVLAIISGTFAGMMLLGGVTCVLTGLDSQGKRRVLCFVLAAGVTALFFISLGQFMIYDVGSTSQDKKVLLLGILITLILYGGLWFFFSTRFLGIVDVLFIAILLLAVAKLPSRYVSAPSPASNEKLKDYFAASNVIRERTTKVEAVLTAPFLDMPMLEVVADRGSVFQLPKAHVVYMAYGLLPSFDTALRSLGFDILAYKGSWVDLSREAPAIWEKTATPQYLRLLGKQYNATTVLTYGDHKLDLPYLYDGVYFNVFSLKAGE